MKNCLYPLCDHHFFSFLTAPLRGRAPGFMQFRPDKGIRLYLIAQTYDELWGAGTSYCRYILKILNFLLKMLCWQIKSFLRWDRSFRSFFNVLFSPENSIDSCDSWLSPYPYAPITASFAHCATLRSLRHGSCFAVIVAEVWATLLRSSGCSESRRYRLAYHSGLFCLY